jgi:hypothetical protein
LPPAGWPDEFVKMSPKMNPNPCFGIKIFWKNVRYFYNWQKLNIANNRLMGEHSPNLVTLTSTYMCVQVSKSSRTDKWTTIHNLILILSPLYLLCPFDDWRTPLIPMRSNFGH